MHDKLVIVVATLTLCRYRIQSNSRDEPLCTQCKIIYDDDYPQKLLHYCNDQDEDLLQRVPRYGERLHLI